jgi:hypothetical protein
VGPSLLIKPAAIDYQSGLLETEFGSALVTMERAVVDETM